MSAIMINEVPVYLDIKIKFADFSVESSSTVTLPATVQEVIEGIDDKLILLCLLI